MRTRLLQVLVGLGLLSVWELVTRLGAVNPLVFPPLDQVLVALVELPTTSQFGHDVAATALTIALALVIGVATGMALGILSWRVGMVGDALAPYLGSMYAMPTLVFYPILVVMLGLGIWPIVVIASVMVLAPVALYTNLGLSDVDPTLPRLARSLHCTGPQRMVKFLLPAAIPLVVTGIRLGATFGVIGTIAMEFMLASRGVGFRIGFNYTNFLVPAMWAEILLVTAFSVGLAALLSALERRLREDLA